MRKQYHFRKSETGILAWDVHRLIELVKGLPVIEIPLSKIDEFDQEFWFEIGGSKPTCRNIAEHMKLVNNTSMDYPIILCSKGKIMDGMHRVCKAHLNNHETIRAVQFSHFIEPDYVGVEPKNLPY